MFYTLKTNIPSHLVLLEQLTNLMEQLTSFILSSSETLALSTLDPLVVENRPLYSKGLKVRDMKVWENSKKL